MQLVPFQKEMVSVKVIPVSSLVDFDTLNKIIQNNYINMEKKKAKQSS